MLKIVELDIKRERFCREYLKNGAVGESYKKAGFKVKDLKVASAAGNRLLKNVKIQERLKELSKEIKTMADVADIAECQQILTKIARNDEVFPKDRVSALNTLLKAQGAFSQNVNLIGAVPVVFNGEDRIPD